MARARKKTISPSEFQLSIDPSIANTGLCLWSCGEVVKYHTLVTPVRNNLATRIEFLLCGLKAFVGGRTITAVAVEEFQGHRANNMLKMMKCSAAQGALIAVSYELTANVILVNKRNESKAVAMAEACKHLTGKINEHEADAFRLGQLAGFDQAGKDHYAQT